MSRAALFGAVNDHLGRGDTGEAVRIAELLVERRPRDELARRLLGRAYERAGRLDAALVAYALAVENGSPHVGAIRGSLEALRQKMRPPGAGGTPARERG